MLSAIRSVKTLAISLLLISPVGYSESTEETDGVSNESVSDILILAKGVGFCGVMNSMVFFQKDSKMTGGDEFVNRFASTELARLDWTVEDFNRICKYSVKRYNNLQELLKD